MRMLQEAHENRDANKREADLAKINSSQITENRSSVHISAITSDDYKCKDCDYCKPINQKATKEEEKKSDECYYMAGFSTGKFRMDHFELALDMGACRSGDFIYFRN